MTKLTHNLTVTFKTSRGRRFDRTFPITTTQATDPGERANIISRAAAMEPHRLVNWSIDPPEHIV
jgi:hypothetical protein